MATATDYWDGRYTLAEGIIHHAQQNEQIARDLISAIQKRPALYDAIAEKLVIEIGCGTGDLSALLTDRLYCQVHGTDLSGFGVEIARIRFPYVAFDQFDILNDKLEDGYKQYDVAVASNVIEHFKDPYSIIEKMFSLAPKVLIVAPFNQPIMDGYESEGGAGHVSCINNSTFDPYKREYVFTFQTDGWSCAESSHQIAALISRK